MMMFVSLLSYPPLSVAGIRREETSWATAQTTRLMRGQHTDSVGGRLPGGSLIED
jgi:hypothetical protein